MQNEAQNVVQVNEDDISLNNRRIVLNFGEKDSDLGTDSDSSEPISIGKTNNDSGNSTPSSYMGN